MPVYSNMSHYTFLERDDDLVPELGALIGDTRTVGWLGTHTQEADFLESALENMRDSLCLLSGLRTRRTRGIHHCPFCSIEQVGPELRQSQSFRCKGKDIYTGSAELQVPSDDFTWFIAPDMIIHYVFAHGYRPPRDFVQAVIDYPARHARTAAVIARIVGIGADIVIEHTVRPLGPVRRRRTRWEIHPTYERLLEANNGLVLFCPYDGVLLWGEEEFSDALAECEEAPRIASMAGVQPIAGEWPECTGIRINDGGIVVGSFATSSEWTVVAKNIGEYLRSASSSFLP